jgi:hypothetical protein
MKIREILRKYIISVVFILIEIGLFSYAELINDSVHASELRIYFPALYLLLAYAKLTFGDHLLIKLGKLIDAEEYGRVVVGILLLGFLFAFILSLA